MYEEKDLLVIVKAAKEGNELAMSFLSQIDPILWYMLMKKQKASK